MRRGSDRLRGARTLLAVVLVLLLAPRASSAKDLEVVPGPSGHLALWLVGGPLFGAPRAMEFTTSPPRADDPRPRVTIESGASILPGRAFELRAGTDGRLDLRKLLHAPSGDAYALVGGVLRARTASDVVIVMGVDDGVQVSLDGERVYERDLWRPALHDDDAVALHLEPGDHPLLVRLRQRSGEWSFGVRLLDASDLMPARNVTLVLPNAEPQDLTAPIDALVKVDVTLAVFSDRYVPTVTVRAPGGLPAPAVLETDVTVASSSGQPIYKVRLGALPRSTRSVHELEAQLPALAGADLALMEGKDGVTFVVQVGPVSRRVERRGVSEVRAAIGKIDDALSTALTEHRAQLADADVVETTLRHARDRLAGWISQGDRDIPAILDEARQASSLAEALLGGRDPLRDVRGPVRLAYRSPLDSRARPFGLYVPPSLDAKPGARFPVVVVLHGLNGLPMQMLRIFFGNDHPWQKAPWEDRHVGALPALDAIVVSPSGFGNLSYREAGEIDVVHLVDWVLATYPADPDRVYVTGLSMGGTGAGSIALRYADRFAAAEPLCGYHSYALRRDMAGRKLRPWEQALASFWSNVSWAENGRNLPLYVVHGKKDLPVQNSGVLIDRYTRLGYRVHAEHPDVGHNVWQQTYEHFKGYGWLAQHRRDPEPAEVVLKTASMRYARNAWVRILALSEHLAWGSVRATVRDRTHIRLETSGVEAVRLERPASRIDPAAPLHVDVDGTALTFASGVEVAMHRRADAWVAGAPPEDTAGSIKKARLTGPIGDVFLEPLVFVYGTADPSMTGANYAVATALASPPYGVEARWPVIADVDVDAALASSHALFLIGSGRSNRYVAAIESALPIRVEGDEIVAGARRFKGPDLGSMFVYPNPRHASRYVVVVQGVGVAGTLRALSLPRLLPDFVIYDAAVAGARGQMVLGSAKVLAGGMFDGSWKLPGDIDDPVATARR